LMTHSVHWLRAWPTVMALSGRVSGPLQGSGWAQFLFHDLMLVEPPT
jgi:hypothetical protein